MQLLPKKATLAALLALLVAGSAACVKQNEPGVGLVKFESSAVFGIEKKETPAVPGFDVPEVIDDLVSNVPLPTRTLAPVDPGPCPEALLTAFPKKSAGVFVSDMPTPGVYKWQRDLLAIKTEADGKSTVTNLPFALEGRAIRRVVRETDHQFVFQMIAPDPFVKGNTVITSFRVNTNDELYVDRRVDSRTIGVVNIPGTDVRVANPADAPGVFITAIEWQNAQGSQVQSFTPVQPMLVLPLEGGILRTGQQFRSVGIDASSGAAIVNDGVTGRASRIDACGEIVEGFAVTLHQTLTDDLDTADPIGAVAKIGLDQETREVTYTFATQYGAMPISETLSINDINNDATAALGKWEIGGLTPTALPDSLK